MSISPSFANSIGGSKGSGDIKATSVGMSRASGSAATGYGKPSCGGRERTMGDGERKSALAPKPSPMKKMKTKIDEGKRGTVSGAPASQPKKS